MDRQQDAPIRPTAFGKVSVRETAELGPAGRGYFNAVGAGKFPSGRAFEFAASGHVMGRGNVFEYYPSVRRSRLAISGGPALLVERSDDFLVPESILPGRVKAPYGFSVECTPHQEAEVIRILEGRRLAARRAN
jgi:hypothetical protein